MTGDTSCGLLLQVPARIAIASQLEHCWRVFDSPSLCEGRKDVFLNVNAQRSHLHADPKLLFGLNGLYLLSSVNKISPGCRWTVLTRSSARGLGWLNPAAQCYSQTRKLSQQIQQSIHRYYQKNVVAGTMQSRVTRRVSRSELQWPTRLNRVSPLPARWSTQLVSTNRNKRIAARLPVICIRKLLPVAWVGKIIFSTVSRRIKFDVTVKWSDVFIQRQVQD